ncbi:MULTISPECIES: hypothetical protein [Trichocoleus]|uniref:Uncharacterized protein n=1 Tax=Trichocoleus desertorum GB2-A4 TaxID=2933944 RepID=A0ABV0JIW8_9CYAN|nr:hypothetical protein [Trichocoleus sp. FACHB-46]MBD1864893.1 hypothetical protein [Trichocoleus sp. FACHB-46]
MGSQRTIAPLDFSVCEEVLYVFFANIAENEYWRAFCSTPQAGGRLSDRKYNNAEFSHFGNHGGGNDPLHRSLRFSDSINQSNTVGGQADC